MVSNTLIRDEHFRFWASNMVKTDEDETKNLLSDTLISRFRRPPGRSIIM